MVILMVLVKLEIGTASFFKFAYSCFTQFNPVFEYFLENSNAPKDNGKINRFLVVEVQVKCGFVKSHFLGNLVHGDIIVIPGKK